MRDTGIADRLREAGLNVVEMAGWQTRGSDTFNPRGSVDHHTAGGRTGNAPSLGICINGRADLAGPLCNVLMGRDNTCYVIAAGRANHAGTGGWNGLTGNSSVYGIERENIGTPEEPWRPDQTDAAARAHAALIRGRAGAENVCRHAEWAPGRKIDTHSIDGGLLRQMVSYYLNNPGGGEDDDMDINQLAAALGAQVRDGRLFFHLRGSAGDEWFPFDAVVHYLHAEAQDGNRNAAAANGNAAAANANAAVAAGKVIPSEVSDDIAALSAQLTNEVNRIIAAIPVGGGGGVDADAVIDKLVLLLQSMKPQV